MPTSMAEVPMSTLSKAPKQEPKPFTAPRTPQQQAAHCPGLVSVSPHCVLYVSWDGINAEIEFPSRDQNNVSTVYIHSIGVRIQTT